MKEEKCRELVLDAVKDQRISVLLRSLGNKMKDWDGIAIDCIKCANEGVEGTARAMLSINPTSIILCANRLESVTEIKISLTHELVHAFDFLHKRYDFTSCNGLASSEIRAAREAECANYTDSKLFPYLRNHCIKDHARRSTRNIFPAAEASECVLNMFNQAMQDNEPFTELEGIRNDNTQYSSDTISPMADKLSYK